MPFFTAPNVYLFKHNNRLYHSYNFVKDDLMRIPKECRRHPFQPYDAPMDNVFGKRCFAFYCWLILHCVKRSFF